MTAACVCGLRFFCFIYAFLFSIQYVFEHEGDGSFGYACCIQFLGFDSLCFRRVQYVGKVMRQDLTSELNWRDIISIVMFEMKACIGPAIEFF